MASIFKLSRDKGKKNRPYYIQYTDHEGNRITIKAFTDKSLSEQLGSKLENEVMLRRRGMIDPTQERLLAIKQSPIEAHLEAFDRSMSNTTEKHRKLMMSRVRRIIEGCKFRNLSDLSGEVIEEWMKSLRNEEDLGARTYNHYLQSVDAFGKWLVSSRRLPGNPISGMERLNSEVDIRHQRRALSPEEVAQLVESARSSGECIQGYDGELRARAYLVSFFTGLRRQEIGSLTPRSFRLDDSQPTVTVEAACSKHRRKDILPLHSDLVVMLREWVQGVDQDQLLFPKIERKKTWLMVKKDLERVGIPYESPEGIADFHAAGRHSHITGLVKSGVSIMQAKELARHADIRQTAKYTHIGIKDQAIALENLPSPFEVGGENCLRIVCTQDHDKAADQSHHNQTQDFDKSTLSDVPPDSQVALEQRPVGNFSQKIVCNSAPEQSQKVIRIGDTPCHGVPSYDTTQFKTLESLTEVLKEADASGTTLDSILKKCLHIVCISGGVECPDQSLDGNEENLGTTPLKAQTPAEAGVVSSFVAQCHELASGKIVEAAGIAPASRDPSVRASTCVSYYLVFVGQPPRGRVPLRLSSHFFSPRQQPAVNPWPARIGVSEHDSRAEVILRSFVVT